MASVVSGPWTGEGQVAQMQMRLGILGDYRAKVLQWGAADGHALARPCSGCTAWTC